MTNRTHETAIKAMLMEPNVHRFLREHMADRVPEEAVLFLCERKALGFVERGDFVEALARIGD